MSAAWLELVSGERKGVAAWAARLGLRLLAAPYGAAVSIRQAMYRAGLRRSLAAPVPVISVGNLTVGGTGKTPLVEYLARGLLERGRRPAIVMRGYKRGGRVSDEAALLRVNLPEGVAVLEQPDRYAGAIMAHREHGADVVVLDDGFQHLALCRDLDVVAVDATSPFGFGRLLPAGYLRESPRALARAGAVVVTRSDLVGPQELNALKMRLAELAPRAAVATSVYRPYAVEEPRGRRDISALRGLDVAVFSGIGNPRAFAISLERLGARIVAARRFADHHAFTKRELEDVAAEARAARAELVLTTQKDAVRIADGDWPAQGPPLGVVRARVELTAGEEALWRAVEGALSATSAREKP